MVTVDQNTVPYFCPRYGKKSHSSLPYETLYIVSVDVSLVLTFEVASAQTVYGAVHFIVHGVVWTVSAGA